MLNVVILVQDRCTFKEPGGMNGTIRDDDMLFLSFLFFFMRSILGVSDRRHCVKY